MSSEFSQGPGLSPAEQSAHPSLLQRIVPKVGAAALIAGGILGVGASAEAAMEIPSHVTFAPGVSADVALQPNITSVSTGAELTVNLPKATVTTPLGKLGANIRLNTITLPKEESNPKDQAVYAALFEQRNDAVIGPVRNALLIRGAAGGTLAAVAEGAAFAAFRRHQKRRANNDAIAQKVAGLGAEIDAAKLAYRNVPEAFDALEKAVANANRKPRRRNLAVRLASFGLSSLSLVGLAQPMYTNSESNTAVPLSPEITSLSPILRGATIEGTSGQEIINGVITYKNNVDNYWRTTVNNNFDKELKKFAAKGGLAYRNNPNLVAALGVSDIHGGFSFMNYTLPHIINGFEVPLVLNMGDTYVSVNKLPGEANIMHTFLNQLRPEKQHGRQVVSVDVSGNHDPATFPQDILDTRFKGADGKKYKPFIALDANHPSATVDGLTFVGWPDGRESNMGDGTTPASSQDQNKLLAEDGDHVDEEACDVQSQTGVTPIIITHAKEAAFKAVSHGCATTALSGHTHVEAPVSKVNASTGSNAVMFTNGTSSGAGENQFTEYAKVTKLQGGELTLMLFDKNTNQLDKTISVIIKPNGDVSFKTDDARKAPHNANLQYQIADFMAQYSSSNLTAAKNEPTIATPSH